MEAMDQMSSATPSLSLIESGMDQMPSATLSLPHLETMDQITSAAASVSSPGLAYYVLCTAYLVVVAIVGLGLNTVFLVSYLMYKRLRTPIGTLYVNLCLADLLISVSSLVKAVYMATGLHMEEGHFMCTMFAFLTFIGGMESLFSLMAIALYRYGVVTRWITLQTVTFRHMVTTLATLWTVGIGLAAGPLFGWNRYVPTEGTWCSLKFNDRSTSGVSYLSVVFSVCFILPVGTMTFTYTAIWLRLNKISNLLGQTIGRQTSRAEKAVVKSSFLMASCFMVAWLPYAALAMYVFIRMTPPTLPYYLAVMPPMMCKASPCLNPIVYFRTDPEIRKYIRKWRESLYPELTGTNGDEEQSMELTTNSTRRKSTFSDKQTPDNYGLDGSKQTPDKYSRISASNKHSNVEAKEHIDAGNQWRESRI